MTVVSGILGDSDSAVGSEGPGPEGTISSLHFDLVTSWRGAARSLDSSSNRRFSSALMLCVLWAPGVNWNMMGNIYQAGNCAQGKHTSFPRPSASGQQGTGKWIDQTIHNSSRRAFHHRSVSFLNGIVDRPIFAKVLCK